MARQESNTGFPSSEQYNAADDDDVLDIFDWLAFPARPVCDLDPYVALTRVESGGASASNGFPCDGMSDDGAQEIECASARSLDLVCLKMRLIRRSSDVSLISGWFLEAEGNDRVVEKSSKFNILQKNKWRMNL
jgi:hypothetical protein